MAVPGEACEEITSCGSTTWGDIPFEENTEYVDLTYDISMGDSDGSAERPWTTITEGIAAAEWGAIVAVAAGSYPENVLIADKTVRLWGRCPQLVEIVGEGWPAVELRGGASGSEVHQLAVTGVANGLVISDVHSITIDGIWAHDTAGRGMMLLDSSAVIHRSLIEHTQSVGVDISGGDILAEELVVQDVSPTEGPDAGIQVYESQLSEQRARLSLKQSVIERASKAGLKLQNTDANVEGVVIRGTMTTEGDKSADGLYAHRTNVAIIGSLIEENARAGVHFVSSEVDIQASVIRENSHRGINVESEDGEKRARLSCINSVVEGNKGSGINILQSHATIEGVVVRHTAPTLLADEVTAGVLANGDSAGGRTTVELKSSLISLNQEAGILIRGSDGDLDGVAVELTFPQPYTNAPPVGISVLPSYSEVDGVGLFDPASLNIKNSLVGSNYFVGIGVWGSRALIESTRVHDVIPYGFAEHLHGIGILAGKLEQQRSDVAISRTSVDYGFSGGIVAADSDLVCEECAIRDTYSGAGVFALGTLKEKSALVLNGTVIERHRYGGVQLINAGAQIRDSIIRDSSANSGDAYGDGIMVSSDEEAVKVSVQNVLIASNARAGVANFWSHVLLDRVMLECNVIHLNGESDDEKVFSFGGSSTDVFCSCPGQGESFAECAVLSSSIQPPPSYTPPTPPNEHLEP